MFQDLIINGCFYDFELLSSLLLPPVSPRVNHNGVIQRCSFKTSFTTRDNNLISKTWSAIVSNLFIFSFDLKLLLHSPKHLHMSTNAT